ncbi:metallophosphoesterase [Lewinella sp. 4G2]|uniref:metallophosphoesterase n=1 Tax=Lewinella sp. 4G2 TaxID=1803372 RepID=UPI0007B4CCE6|nr:metallophosphoesterase [Lewinella sp. 4G2]OAV42623.1 phosphoesterase [Lewinella sp. 4G2]
MIGRLLVLLATLLALDVYAYQAVRSWVSPYSQGRRRLIKGVYLGITLIAYLLLALNIVEVTDSWGKEAKTLVRVFLFLSWLCKLPIVLVLLIDDLRRGAKWVGNKVSPVTKRDTSRSRFLAKAALIAGGVPLATLTYGIVRNAYRYRRFAVDVPIEGLPAGLDGVKIVQISDMHSGSWTKSEPLKDAVRLINEEEADIVCFTGDLVNEQAVEMAPFVDIFKEVKGKHGVYSVLGNHDYGDYHQWPSDAAKVENMETLYATHEKLGWDLLRDEHRKVEINGHKIAIMGVENWGSAFRFPRKADLPKATAGTNDCDCKILMSHDPTHWDAKIRPGYPDIDLTLSGHTHGFQFGVEIPGFRWSPAQYLYKQWAGLYREGKQYLYVNRGLGFLGYPGRVGILPEVTVLTLRSA